MDNHCSAIARLAWEKVPFFDPEHANVNLWHVPLARACLMAV
jgi:hypothetical protein